MKRNIIVSLDVLYYSLLQSSNQQSEMSFTIFQILSTLLQAVLLISATQTGVRRLKLSLEQKKICYVGWELASSDCYCPKLPVAQIHGHTLSCLRLELYQRRDA